MRFSLMCTLSNDTSHLLISCLISRLGGQRLCCNHCWHHYECSLCANVVCLFLLYCRTTHQLLLLINVIGDNMATWFLWIFCFMCELNWSLSVHLLNTHFLRISRGSSNQETRRGIQKSWEQKSKERVKHCVCLLECKLWIWILVNCEIQFKHSNTLLWFTVALLYVEKHILFFYLGWVDGFRRPQVFMKLLQVGSCFNLMVVH